MVRVRSSGSPSGRRRAASIAIRSGRSRRTSGSPPVIRSFSTPSATKTRASRSISSKRQDLGARQEREVAAEDLAGHAVGAPEVAAVGDRDPQVVQAAAEAIELRLARAGRRTAARRDRRLDRLGDRAVVARARDHRAMVTPTPAQTLGRGRGRQPLAVESAGFRRKTARVTAGPRRRCATTTAVAQLAVTADTEAIPVRDLRYHRIDRLVPLAHSTGPPPAPTMPTRPQRLQPELSPGGNRTIHGDDRITHRLPTPLELGGAE